MSENIEKKADDSHSRTSKNDPQGILRSTAHLGDDKDDWKCQACPNINFARRSECNKCGAKRPVNASRMKNIRDNSFDMPVMPHHVVQATMPMFPHQVSHPALQGGYHSAPPTLCSADPQPSRFAATPEMVQLGFRDFQCGYGLAVFIRGQFPAARVREHPNSLELTFCSFGWRVGCAAGAPGPLDDVAFTLTPQGNGAVAVSSNQTPNNAMGADMGVGVLLPVAFHTGRFEWPPQLVHDISSEIVRITLNKVTVGGLGSDIAARKRKVMEMPIAGNPSDQSHVAGYPAPAYHGHDGTTPDGWGASSNQPGIQTGAGMHSSSVQAWGSASGVQSGPAAQGGTMQGGVQSYGGIYRKW
eukprot:CAMPEP_0185756490 /NCGR_PEP_ID=MMETSP1174-20130828/14916_1 /TAXON_ID=35687 /ORGANISM="Dictyocha speculum, Strain CCMP1381" /LENGTH=356 /DNA_ID=CAMNT_0028435477 /DNA_START=15 /DNA_END=1085 /DNA_ORIENTATION=+